MTTSQEATVHPHSDSPLRGFRLVGLCTLASRMLGMVRDVAMATAFGASPVMDAFTVAFRIPNLARRLFGEGAQTSAFLPIFIRVQQQSGGLIAQQFAGGMFHALARLLCGLVLVTELVLLAVWWLVPLSGDTAFLIEMLLWLIPYLLGICLAAQQSAVLHGLRQFAWPAILPIVLNLIWLAAIPIAFTVAADPADRMRWLCAAILLAGGVQLAIPVIVLRRQGFPITSHSPEIRPLVRSVFQAMGPVLVGVTITQINTVFDSFIAWALAEGASNAATPSWLPTLPAGTATALYFGQRMYQFPLGLIGVGLGTVLFPQFSRHAEREDRPSLNRDLTAGLRLTLSIGVPSGVGLMLLAEPITRLLFQHGAYTPEAGALTSSMIVAYGVGVWALIGLLIVQRAYYAVGDRLSPVHHGCVAMALNLVLDIALLFPLGATGLAWATALSACVQMLLATWIVQRHIGRLPWGSLLRTTLQTAVACIAMTLVVRGCSFPPAEPLLQRATAVGVPLVAGAVAYLATAAAIGLRDPWRLLRHGAT